VQAQLENDPDRYAETVTASIKSDVVRVIVAPLVAKLEAALARARGDTFEAMYNIEEELGERLIEAAREPITAPPDKLLRRKADLRVGAACWCFGTGFLRSRSAQSWPLKRDGQPHRTRRIRAGAAGAILDCACAPILTGTAGGTSAKPSPLPRTPEKG
jgi:hypothetical protein